MRSMIEALGTVEMNVKGIATEGALITRAKLSCEDKDWDKARELIDQALTINPENGEAYLVKLMVDTKSCAENEVSLSNQTLNTFASFQRAQQFGNDDLPSRLTAYQQGQESHWQEAIRAARVGSRFTIDTAWRVLERKDGRLLVIREHIHSNRPYHQPGGDITWEHCTLRQWLNTEYLSRMPPFLASRIAEVKTQNPIDPKLGTEGYNVTNDKVFLLSVDEANRYFKDDNDRKAWYNGWDYWWWLRLPGTSADRAACVGSNGGIYADAAYFDYDDVGVRPAFWLNL
jgi:hypothetical protein